MNNYTDNDYDFENFPVIKDPQYEQYYEMEEEDEEYE